MAPLAPRTISALRATRSCFGIDPHAPGPSNPLGPLLTSPSDLRSYLFFFGLIATTFLL
jgi:hypothetical protein